MSEKKKFIDRVRSNISVLISIATLLGIAFGVYFWAERNYATAKDVKNIKNEVKQVADRLDYHIISDQRDDIQKRIWEIEDRCGKNPRDKTINEELRQLKERKEVKDRRLRKMENDREEQQRKENSNGYQ